MERNWDTVRELLVAVEKCSLPRDQVRLAQFPAERQAEIAYHMALLIEAGLVDGIVSQAVATVGPRDFIARRLTWQGHEILDSIRSETVWGKTKKTFRDQGISMTFDLVKSVAKEVAATAIRSAMGGA